MLPKSEQPTKKGFWHIPPMWEGETVFIIGGGPSLSQMDLTPLHGRCVLGVNSAYTLGDWVLINYFGDQRWWSWNNQRMLAEYGGLIVTDQPASCFHNHPRIQHLVRDNNPVLQWKFKNRVGWFKNSGGTAINVALHLGAKRVVLLGFDMKVAEGQPNHGHNWHNDHRHTPRTDIYKRFMGFMSSIPDQIIQYRMATKREFEVVNATPDSAMDIFPKVPLEAVL